MTSPFALAATGQLERLTDMLNGRQFDVNARDEEQRTCLHWAAFNGRTDVVQLLLRYGADINAVDARSVTALMVAALNAHAATVAALLQFGARGDIRSVQGRTAESVAPNAEILALLRRGVAAAAAPPNLAASPVLNNAISSKPAAPLPVGMGGLGGKPALQRTRAVTSGVAVAPGGGAGGPAGPAAVGAMPPSSPMAPHVPQRRPSGAPQSALVASASTSAAAASSPSSSLEAQVADLSAQLVRANAQIASLLERVAAERAANARLHDRLRELGGAPGSRGSGSEAIEVPKGLSPRSAAAERQRASPPGNAPSSPSLLPSQQPQQQQQQQQQMQPGAPRPRVAPRARSTSPPPATGQLPMAVGRGMPPPVGPRVPPVLASSPPKSASPVFAPQRGSSTAGLFEPMMDSVDDESDRNQLPLDSHYHSLAGVQLLDDYGSVPKTSVPPAPAVAAGGAYGTLPAPAPLLSETPQGLYIMPHEDFF